MRSKSVGGFYGWSVCAGILAIATSFGIAPSASADIIPIQSNSAASTNGLGSFTGTLDYAFNMAMMGTLTITLTNTSPAANGGFITAFLFDINSADSNADAQLQSSTDPDFNDLTNGNGQPFGMGYNSGASIDNSFQGSGGNPNMGIGTGQSATFVFKVTASDASTLTASSFITSSTHEFGFLVRFRGFENNSSDKVPGQIVPGPAVLTAMALGLAMFAGRRRMR